MSEAATHSSEVSDCATAAAISFRAPVARPGASYLPPSLPGPGDTLHDFELVRILGAGSFARVFLANQVSLGRQVALKVSVNQGQEGRTLAILEHDHIVRVFSEIIDSERDLRLLCMQYVPGTTLDRVILQLANLPPELRTGRGILDVIDAESAEDAALLDLAALRDREELADLDPVEAVCWIGARLGEALAHAHGLGVLHRDIKPANVLMNRYGRPLLADFNIAVAKSVAGQPLGGTLGYMAPEHLDAFNPADLTPAEAVGPQADIYSLGVLLYELYTGKLPFPGTPQGDPRQVLRAMADSRRQGAPPLSQHIPAPPSLERVLARCLAPEQVQRFGNAGELVAALESCRELRRVALDLPPESQPIRWLHRWPVLGSCLLLLLPHLLGSAINIPYNTLRIVNKQYLDDAQREAFGPLVFVYNLIVYPLCLYLLARRMIPVIRAWKCMTAGSLPRGESANAIDEARRRALTFPVWCVALSCLGWLPGGILIPLGLDYFAGPIDGSIYGKFLFSFTISGLIALTYSCLATEFLVLRVLYPVLWLDARQLRETARGELEREEGRLSLLQLVAVLIPLSGAALLLSVGPGDFSEEGYRRFRVLVTGLLALGMTGLGLAVYAAGELRRVIAVFLPAAMRYGARRGRMG